MSSLLHAARPVLLNFGERGALRVDEWTNRGEIVDAVHEGEWQLPALGAVAAPGAVLIRPDGYVAWVGNDRKAGLVEALATWCGLRSEDIAGRDTSG